MRSRLLFLLFGLLLGIGLTIGSTWANGYRTTMVDEGNSMSVMVPKSVPGDSHTFAIARVCKDGTSDVMVTGVRVAESYGHRIEIVGFAVAPSLAIGSNQKSDLTTYLVDAKAPSTGPRTTTLSTPCNPANDIRDVVVEMRVPPAEDLPAAAIRFVIDYEVRGRTKSITTDYGITFCRGDDTDWQVDGFIEEHPDDPVSGCDV